MQDRLQQILLRKRAEIADLGSDLERMRREARPSSRRLRSMARALKKRECVTLIAEVKRASPSAGPIAPDCDPIQQALCYADAGAEAISVLTDAPFFSGSLEDLRQVRAAVDLPLLRKDFILSPVQLYQSVLMGADAVLLIVAALSPPELRDLHALALDLALEPLVEVHDPAELDRALSIDAKLIGINNRNLHTFSIDLAATERLVGSIPEDRVAVSESGIVSGNQAGHFRSLGVDAILVGEALMRSANPKAKVAELRRGAGEKGERRPPR
ncbi:indole-3-glycerol phosphate synthase TrpC [Methylacidimicrobium sp. B4]|uniref:indole-3-glycerol phosphate synthase TrpC n=1 Tax=Methylacidimicrobium sp. B4 TaxID=2796139 RepID=UPI001A8C20BF|nr:indole-3-glycerol phosphate synthase TrpC [Methylacidimicrobium sp. B4]QSR83825.1 indole-3-glycerol phosphate synthase TrpC [Methylacidimicrobium sp. B4]